MSSENPTPLRVGATGALNGWRVRVAGRVVLGVEIDGETYHWNEFNLVDGFGRSATLVFEEGEHGPEWKLFKDFMPLRAVTAAEAATKRVGDRVSLDGTPRAITLADQSRVIHIEGTAPEGVEVGDVAHYFNVDTGERMLVASWTGDEIEFYEGNDVPGAAIAAAFNLNSGAPAFSAPTPASSSETSGGSNTVLKLVGAALVGLILFGFISCSLGGRNSRSASAPPPPKKTAPVLRLATGVSGTIAEKAYTISDHATVEIARVGARHDRHEYSLSGDTGEGAFLINGLTGAPKEWHLFVPVAPTGPLAALTPYEAALRKKGSPLPLAERTLRITELFQSKTLNVDRPSGAQTWPPLQYGFVARDADNWVIARWTAAGIQFHRGLPLAETAVLAAFGPGPEKAR